MDITTLVQNLGTYIINPIILLIFAAAVLVFVWGLVEFLWALNVSGKESDNGKRHMLWGLVGMFIMVAAWGILKLIEGTIASIR
jgi:hypothetical protein